MVLIPNTTATHAITYTTRGIRRILTPRGVQPWLFIFLLSQASLSQHYLQYSLCSYHESAALQKQDTPAAALELDAILNYCAHAQALQPCGTAMARLDLLVSSPDSRPFMSLGTRLMAPRSQDFLLGTRLRIARANAFLHWESSSAVVYATWLYALKAWIMA